MPNVIKPKRSAVAGNIPTTSQISQYEIAMNTADKKIFTSNGTDIIQLSSGTLAGLSDVNLSSLSDGQTLSYNTATGKWVNSTPGTGGSSNWILKTSAYTAISGDKILANTTSASFTITLPATPSTGASVIIADVGNFATNTLTVARNGSTIEGLTEDLILDIGGVLAEIVYSGTTWQVYAQAGVLSGGGGGGSAITVSDEGTLLTSGATSFNFTGSGVTASADGTAVTVNVSGGGTATYVVDDPVFISQSQALSGSTVTVKVSVSSLLSNTSVSSVTFGLPAGNQTVSVTNGQASTTFTISGSVGIVVPVTAFATDEFGNTSRTVTHNITISTAYVDKPTIRRPANASVDAEGNFLIELSKYSNTGTFDTPYQEEYKITSEPNGAGTVYWSNTKASSDPYLDNNILMFPCDTFNDVSKYSRNFTFTGATVNTYNNYYVGSAFSFGANGYASYSSTSTDEFNLTNEDFTIECSFRTSTAPPAALGTALIAKYDLTTNRRSWAIRLQSTSTLDFLYSVDGVNAVVSTGITVAYNNLWQHATVIRSAGTIYIYLNGILKTTINVGTASFFSTNAEVELGRYRTASGISYLNGELSNIRITKGVARYSSDFSLPRSILPNTIVPVNAIPVGTTAYVTARLSGTTLGAGDWSNSVQITNQSVGVKYGDPYQGGFYAGQIKIGTSWYAIVVAPFSQETSLASATGTTGTLTTQAKSITDGLSNTNELIANSSTFWPAAKYCYDLDYAGYTDWYLPSVMELDLIYRTLKPTTDVNITSNISASNLISTANTNFSGNAVLFDATTAPSRLGNYGNVGATALYPSISTSVNFQGYSVIEGFSNETYWTSTGPTGNTVARENIGYFRFSDGAYFFSSSNTGDPVYTTTVRRVRPVRRVFLRSEA